MPVLQPLDWYLPRFRDDGMASSVEPPDFPALDRQTFTREEKKALLGAPWDIRMADRRWFNQYKVGIEDRKRRFLISLALHMADTGEDFARASAFYEEFIEDYPQEVPLADGKRPEGRHQHAYAARLGAAGPRPGVAFARTRRL
jgi:hypothetical protein